MRNGKEGDSPNCDMNVLINVIIDWRNRSIHMHLWDSYSSLNKLFVAALLIKFNNKMEAIL